MKFGITAPPVGPRGSSDADLYQAAVEDAKLAQSLGYDSVWTLEHHFTPYFPQPDLLLFLSHVAAHCPGLGLGTAVIVLPWHNPIRLAEQIAMLSLLSEGQLYLGIGRGTARYEFERLNVDMEQTRGIFHEIVEIVRKGLTGEPFNYQGEHFQFPELRIRPKARADRVNLYGAIGSPQSAEVMADLGLPIIHTSNFPDDKAEVFVQTWAERMGVGEIETKAHEFPIHMNPCIVAPTDAEAFELAHVYYPHFARVQMEHYESKDDYWKDIKGYEVHSRFFKNLARMAEDADFRQRYFHTQIVGAPETVIKRIEVLRDRLHVGHVIAAHAQYEMEPTLRRRSIQLFAEEVIPHFRNPAAAA